MQCFRCDTPLKEVKCCPHNVSGGLPFATGGQYGSAVFDPMDGSCIEIRICDYCLVANSANVLYYKSSRDPATVWQPEESKDVDVCRC